jgi:hypothetical protein
MGAGGAKSGGGVAARGGESLTVPRPGAELHYQNFHHGFAPGSPALFFNGFELELSRETTLL